MEQFEQSALEKKPTKNIKIYSVDLPNGQNIWDISKKLSLDVRSPCVHVVQRVKAKKEALKSVRRLPVIVSFGLS